MDLYVPAHVRPLRDRFLQFMRERIIASEPTLHLGQDRDPEAKATLEGLAREVKEAGLWAMGHPTEIGGGGLPFMDYVYINEVVGMSEYGMYIFGTHSLQDAIMFHVHASPEQREKYLLPLVRGDIRSCFAMTEPEVASSDPTQLKTTAELDGDDWLINGHKWFISNAGRAAFTTIMARTEPPDTPAHESFSMILVPNDAPGYSNVRPIPVMGSIDGNHCEVTLENVRVPRTNILGPRGGAFKMAQQRLGPGRIFHCMRWLGQAQRAFDLMCERAVSRIARGSTLAEKQLVQKMIFDSAAEIRAHRAMTLEAAGRMDEGDPARVEIGLIKVVGATMLHNVIDRAIQVHGGAGLTGDLPLERMYRNSRSARIYDGPDEVHITNVARLLLRPYRGAVQR
jgi:acyl-CoA dehydrogenase